jgi:hypothetical protein
VIKMAEEKLRRAESDSARARRLIREAEQLIDEGKGEEAKKLMSEAIGIMSDAMAMDVGEEERVGRMKTDFRKMIAEYVAVAEKRGYKAGYEAGLKKKKAA